MDEALVVYVDRTSALVGIVVVDERRLHAAALQVNAATVARGVTFLHGAAGQVCVTAVHIYARATVGLKLVKPRAALGVAAAYGYAVKISGPGEGFVAVEGCKPYHVARVARRCPLIVVKLKVVFAVVGGREDGLYGLTVVIEELPRHSVVHLFAAFVAHGLRCLTSHEAAVDTDAVAHTKRGRISRARHQLGKRLVLSGGHPHLATLAVAALGQTVNHGLEVA